MPDKRAKHTRERRSEHPESAADGPLTRSAAVIGAAAFATTLAEMEIIGLLPIRYLLIRELGVQPEKMSLFFLLSGVAWYAKPIAGLTIDSVRLFGTRRRHYLMMSAVGAALCWLCMAWVPRMYYPILFTAVVLNGMLVVASTAMGALMVEEAQRLGATGRFNSLREGLSMLAGAVGLIAGGYLAEAAFGWTAVSAAAILAALSLVVLLFLREKAAPPAKAGVWRTAEAQLSVMVHSKTLLAAAVLIFLFYMAPGIGTPLYYLQTNKLAFSQSFIGWQGVIASVMGMSGAFLYSRVCKLLPLRPLLVIGILLGTVGTLFYLGYESMESAVVIVAVNGLLGTFGVLPLFDLATRATPKGCEGLGFALMMSLRNFALFSGDLVGSWLMQSYHWPFGRLVVLNAVFTFLVLVVIPFLPAALVRTRDGEAPDQG
jgi:MFS family permease